LLIQRPCRLLYNSSEHNHVTERSANTRVLLFPLWCQIEVHLNLTVANSLSKRQKWSSRPVPFAEDWNSRLRCRLVSQTMSRSFFLLDNCHQDPHRTVLALFTHTALHMAIHRDSYILTIIRGSGRGNSSSILLNFCQLRHPLFPRRFSHLNRRFLTSCANLPIPRALSVTP